MSSPLASNIAGIAVVSPNGDLIVESGIAADRRFRVMTTDRAWRDQAVNQRLTPVHIAEGQFAVVAAATEDSTVIFMIYEAAHATVMKFLSSVDFAFDIINHILTDPYDAMAVVDDQAKLVFVSPIHEKFFGLKTDEGVGKKVQQVIENTRLPHVVRTGVAEIGQLQKMNGRERVVSRHPIRRNGEVVGAIGRVMFKGPQQVEALSRRVNALEQEIEQYRNESREASKSEHILELIVGSSPAIQQVKDHIRKIAPLDIPVLIQGESGTGKELVAQALHMLSPRNQARLVTVNAAALPAQLVESELFGYEAGSFTGADRKGRAGKFEQADHGTIFLDEIGDMPLDVQSKLLRVLQDRVVERVGGDNPRKIDFRVVSATNRDLEEFVDQGKFRLDLFYRISPTIIMMPKLSERAEDIPLLVDSFLASLAAQYSRPALEAGQDVYDYLMDRDWPGNVRELRHVVERAMVYCEGTRLTVDNFLGASMSAAPASLPTTPAIQSGGSLKRRLEEVERELVTEAMGQFNGNKKKVAEYLGISRTYLYKKLGMEAGE
jgi:PAS domain S-box-containing protein